MKGNDSMSASSNTRKLVVMAMLSVIAYASTFVTRQLPPLFLFLQYDPKDIVIAMGGFILGPIAAFAISVVVSIVEMVTISDTGPVGMLMNVLASCAFACPAAFIYKKMHSKKGAVIGLFSGVIAMTLIMILWNWLITPMYMGVPRQAVVEMLIPIFLPFNLIKAGINMALTLLLYKPVVTALRKAGLVAEHVNQGKVKFLSSGMLILSVVIVATCVLVVLVIKGVM